MIERISLIPGRFWDVTSPLVSTWPPYWRVSTRFVESSGGKLYRESHVCISVVPYALHRQIPALSRLSYFGCLPISGHGDHISSKFQNERKGKTFLNFGFSVFVCKHKTWCHASCSSTHLGPMMWMYRQMKEWIIIVGFSFRLLSACYPWLKRISFHLTLKAF